LKRMRHDVAPDSYRTHTSHGARLTFRKEK